MFIEVITRDNWYVIINTRHIVSILDCVEFVEITMSTSNIYLISQAEHERIKGTLLGSNINRLSNLKVNEQG